MQIFIKTNSKKVLNYIDDQTEKAKQEYFKNKYDFLEHLFQSIPLIIPWTEISFEKDLNFKNEIVYTFETGNLNMQKKYYTWYNIDDKYFIY